jgi:acyl-coenzyme A thioesterase PaaI-like protein
MATTDETGAPRLDEEQQRQYRQAVPATMLRTPYLSSLGLLFEQYEPDLVRIRLPFREDLTNDGTYYHGGVIAAVMDTTGAATAWSNHDFNKGARASTVSIGAVRRSGEEERPGVCGASRAPGARAHLHRDHLLRGRGRGYRPRVQTYRIV